MTVTGTYTVRDIVTDALLEIEAVPMGQAVPARLSDHAVRSLNRLMKSWQLMDGSPSFLKASYSLTLTTAQSYSLVPERPIRILSARFKRDGIELPMTVMTRDDWDTLPQKAVTGTPTQYYYDRQKEDALFYVWPKLSAANGETVEITYEREFNDVGINDTIDLPGEWWNAAVFGLAANLVGPYGSDKVGLKQEAAYYLNLALAAGMDGETVTFCG